MADLISNSKGDQDLLARLKSQIRTAQVRDSPSRQSRTRSALLGNWKRDSGPPKGRRLGDSRDLTLWSKAGTCKNKFAWGCPKFAIFRLLVSRGAVFRLHPGNPLGIFPFQRPLNEGRIRSAVVENRSQCRDATRAPQTGRGWIGCLTCAAAS
jgi:hypothetical protein